MYRVTAYFKFLFLSTNHHGVHSPFVYDLLSNCLYRKDKKPAHVKIENLRREILQDHRKIKRTNLAFGGRIPRSGELKVSDIAKNAGISKKKAILLHRFTSYLNFHSALEIGTSVGILSAAIASGNPLSLTTLEGCPETAGVAREYFKRFKLDNITLVGSMEELLRSQNRVSLPTTDNPIPPTENKYPRPYSEPANSTIAEDINTETGNQQVTPVKLRPTTQNLQASPEIPQLERSKLVFFHGNHHSKAILKHFNQLLPLAQNDSVFIFDDIHGSSAMEETWEEIKRHPRVRVTIDSFFWGIVFFRKEQEKEHFVIRL